MTETPRPQEQRPQQQQPQQQILVGVHLVDDAPGLAATLASLLEHTPLSFNLRLLPDDALASQAAARQGVQMAAPALVQLPVPQQAGAAACFNQLVSEPADIYVFLEGGVQVAPGWLERMLTALGADANRGLAGPSTNRGWNEQAVAPACAGTPQALCEQADALQSRFGDACVSLAPLHSLGDFCYVVTNEVVAAIGAADTAYAQGPCWEMDYNVRAARAGFEGVWVQAAFVHRAPRSVSAAAVQDGLLAPNKRLYQDRFCGLRKQGGEGNGRGGKGRNEGDGRLPRPVQPPAYHTHCAGEVCRHFAVPELVQIFHSLPPPATAPKAPAQAAMPPAPLMSCIMPTRGRAAFVAQSIRYFQRQDYPTLELIIVYETDADLPAGIDDARIRCIRVPGPASIGTKRNEAVRAARGALIAHWDDDDWYAAERLSRQAAPILYNVADVTGLNDMLFMARPLAQFWACSRALFRQMFVENVSGGTLVFRRSLWQLHGGYPDTSLREDADFLQKAVRGGARLCRISGRALCTYVRHDGNTWKFKEGEYLQKAAWRQVPLPECLRPDGDFYFPPAPTPAETSSAPTPSRALPMASRAMPMVSCIMPTADRRAFVPQAIRNFLAQDHGPRELIVLDDGRDSVAELIAPHEHIRYVRLDRKSSIGTKRNIACELARGELVAHWDDDDWMAPGWLSSQVRVLQAQQADLCGLDKVYFYEPLTRRAWQYVYDGRTPWVCGGTLCYRRDFWRSAPFADIDVGEDNAFVWSPQPKRIAVNPDRHLYVARVHAHNTSPKDTLNRRWHPWPAEQVEQLMGPP